MTVITLYFASLAIFLLIDFLALGIVVKPIFDRQIGHLLLENFRLLPAFFFYAFFVGVMIWFVSFPATTQDKGLLWVAFNAALLGAAAFGTYEFTSLAIMKDWTWKMVIVDMVWGTTLTALSAMGGVWVTRLLLT